MTGNLAAAMTARCCAGPDDPYCAIRGPKALLAGSIPLPR